MQHRYNNIKSCPAKQIISFILVFTTASIVFGQNSLEDYLQSAIKNSPVFIENLNQQRSLALDSQLVRARLKPHVNITSNNLYAPVFDGYGYDEIITNKGNYNVLAGVSYTLVGKNNRNNQNAFINLQKQNLELNAKLSERDLKQAVTSQYIVTYGDQQIMSHTLNILDVLEKEELILKRSAEAGIYRQTDYLAFLENYKQQQIAYAQNKIQMQYDLYLLNYLCGISDTSVIPLNEPMLKTTQPVSIEQSYSFRQYYLDSLSLKNSMEQIKFNYKPKLNLTGDAGYNTTFLYHAEKNFGASAGLNFSIPIYDGNQRKLQEGKLTLAENSRLAKMEFYKKQYSLAKIQLIRQINETENLINLSKEQLQISETLLKANSKLLETGDIKIADYILSLTNTLSSRTTIQQLITGKLQLINQFNYLNY